MAEGEQVLYDVSSSDYVRIVFVDEFGKLLSPSSISTTTSLSAYNPQFVLYSPEPSA